MDAMKNDKIKGSKASKGQYGYIRRQRRIVALKTVLMFGISFSLYLSGVITTGNNQNLLTIVAVLGCLPACKSMVTLIMYLRAGTCSSKVYQKIESAGNLLPQLYDLYFTSYQKNYQISHLVVADKLICGFSEQEGLVVTDCEKHMETTLKQGGLKGIKVKVFQDIEKYTQGIKTLSEEKGNGAAGEEDAGDILSGIMALSL